MTGLSIDPPVTPLRRRMLDDVAMRGSGERTRRSYVREVRAFAGVLGRSPDKVTAGVSEVAHLKVGDIDGKRMLIRIEEGKGMRASAAA